MEYNYKHRYIDFINVGGKDMLTLYLDKHSIKKRFINSVDLAFDKFIYNLMITDKDRKDIMYVDNAIYEGNGYITTSFGRTEIQNLSTGCKTLILLNHSKDLKNPVINISECGRNVLDKIFELNNVSVYLSFCMIPRNYNPEKEIMLISKNDKRIVTLQEVFNKAWRRRK